MNEEPLVGGNNTNEVVRIGRTVRRTRGPRSDYVARVLIHLESVGFRHAPRYLGVDDSGRDVLSYLAGRTSDHPSQRAAGAYRRAGQMLRRLHDVTAGHPLAEGGECVTHGDPGPFNAILRDGLPVAFIDWDGCGPGRRLDDLGYLAWTWCIQSTGQVPIGDQARHLRELRDGYGTVDGGQLLAAMTRRCDDIVTAETAIRDDLRLPESRRRHAVAAVAWADAGRRLVRGNETRLLGALA